MTGAVMNGVPMRVVDARRSGRSVVDSEAAGVVLLSEIHGERRMAIWIGPDEATEIALALEHVLLPRPGPYEFTAALLAGAGSGLREVRVSELRGALFYAQAVLDNGAVIDARPSDALTLALLLDVPIRVDEAVLSKLGSGDSELRDAPADWASYENASQIADAFRAIYAEQRILRREDLPAE
jgi:bifunctional DNase/RNase